MEPIASIPVGAGPHGSRPSPDGKWVYVANIADTTLSVIDTDTDKKVADVEVGQAPAQSHSHRTDASCTQRLMGKTPSQR